MSRKLPIFYSALLLTGVNLLLRFVGTSFQVYLSGTIGAAGIGLLQLVMSVGSLAMTAAMAGIRTATMYLTAEELGKGRPKNVTWVLSGCFIYSILCSSCIGIALYNFAPKIAADWIGDIRTVAAIRMYAGCLPISCLCGVMTGYFTAANRIGTLAIVEVAEQFLSLGTTMLLLTVWGGSSPAKACCCMIAGNAVGTCMTLASLICLRVRQRPDAGHRIKVSRRLTEAAVPLAFADNLKAGISTTENLMVPKRLALYTNVQDPLAAFGTVCGMVFPVLMFPAGILFALAELLIPELARCAAAGSQTRICYLVRRSLRVAFLYGCIFGGLEFLLAKPFCLVLYKNAEAGKYLQRYALMIPMLYCDAITDAMTKGLGEQKACVRYNILTSSLDVLFLFVLLPRYGMDGYLLSFFITHLLNFLLSLRRLLKITGITLQLKLPALGIFAAVLAIILLHRVSSAFFQAVGYIGLFLSFLTLFGVVGKDDLVWLKGLTAKKHHDF